MNHSKGTWEVTNNGKAIDAVDYKQYEDGGFNTVCHIVDLTEAKDNARLIASAPEMYKVLKQIKLEVDDSYSIADGEHIKNLIEKTLKKIEVKE